MVQPDGLCNGVMNFTRGPYEVLLVDDAPQLRTNCRKALEYRDFIVREASHGVEAIAVIEREGPPKYSVITDMRMPLMDGFELTEELCRRYPGLPIVQVSGDSSLRFTSPYKLTKPFVAARLIEVISRFKDLPWR